MITAIEYLGGYDTEKKEIRLLQNQPADTVLFIAFHEFGHWFDHESSGFALAEPTGLTAIPPLAPELLRLLHSGYNERLLPLIHPILQIIIHETVLPTVAIQFVPQAKLQQWFGQAATPEENPIFEEYVAHWFALAAQHIINQTLLGQHKELTYPLADPTDFAFVLARNLFLHNLRPFTKFDRGKARKIFPT